MNLSIRNIEKFFDDNPGLKNGDEIISSARNAGDAKGIIPRKKIIDIMGIDLSNMLFDEVKLNIQHIKICAEDMSIKIN